MDQAKQSTESTTAQTEAMGQPGSSASADKAPVSESGAGQAQAASTGTGSSVVSQKSAQAPPSTQTIPPAREPPGVKQDPPASLAATESETTANLMAPTAKVSGGSDQVTTETPKQPLVTIAQNNSTASRRQPPAYSTQQPALTANPLSSIQPQTAYTVAATSSSMANTRPQLLPQISHPSSYLQSSSTTPLPPTSQLASQPVPQPAAPPPPAARPLPSHTQMRAQNTTQPSTSLTHLPPQPITELPAQPQAAPLSITAVSAAQKLPVGPLSPSTPRTQQQPLHSTVSDRRSVHEDQIAQQRSVLVDRYAPYIEPSDRSLHDARVRLQTALTQVRQLRAAFTERVYGKYRVCLKPPEPIEETINGIKSNPVAASRRLEQEIRLVKEEKEVEKKEAQSLNAELSKMDPALLASVSADNAEQLMYISAGLSLVILPEDDVDPKLLEGYEDRGPINPATGQRVRSISQAAAAAGEVILERTRKAKAMRNQFQHQRQTDGMQQESLQSEKRSPLELLTAPTPTPAILTNVVKPPSAGTKSGPEVKATPQVTSQGIAASATIAPKVDTNLANLQAKAPEASSAQPTPAATMPGSADSKGTKKPTTPSAPPPSTSKFGRSRGGAGISVHVSLSLNPTADEITEKPNRASTAALLARGVGTAQGISRASPQQRLRHPHPESAGGKQRASSATSAKKELASLKQALSPTTSQSYLNYALPPLPTPLERRERKPLTVLDPSRSGSIRAKRAIASVLTNLTRRNVTGACTKVALLHDIHKSRKLPAQNGQESARDRPIDPTLAFSVLQSIGFVTEVSDNGDGITLMKLEDKVGKLPRGEKRKLESLEGLTDMWDKLGVCKKPRLSDAYLKRPQATRQIAAADQQAKAAAVVGSGRASPPVEKIRGGGVTEELPSRESPPIESIRGGGEMMPNANGDSSSPNDGSSRKNNQRTGGAAYGNHVGQRVDNRMMPNNMGQNAHHGQPRWDGQAMNIMNSHLAAGSVHMGANGPGALSGQVGTGHPGQQQGANNAQAQSTYALHLAHQLRNASNNMGGMQARGGHQNGDVSVGNYIAGLHQHGQWSTLGSSAAVMAAAAAQSSLAALGLSVPMGVYSSVQDRAARAMLAREQQNVAAAHAVAAHQQSVANSVFAGGAANPGFAPTNSNALQQHANARNAMLNSAAQQYRVVNQPSVVTTMPPQQQQQQRSGVLPTAFGRQGVHTHRNPEPNYQQVAPPASHATHNRNKRNAEEALAEKSKKDHKATAASKKPRHGPGATAAAAGGKAPSVVPKSQPKAAVAHSKPKAVAVAVALKTEAPPAATTQKGMQFFPPRPPPSIPSEHIAIVQTGQLHRLAGADCPGRQPRNSAEIVDFLVAVGTAIPIPKALVLSSLKDRLNLPGFKNLASSAGFVTPRDIVVAAIIVWLWNNHEQDFQRAFSLSGRIDVDPTCKWLVHAAVDGAVRGLTQYITDTEMTAGVPRKNTSSTTTATPGTSDDNSFSAGLATAYVVSKSLTTESCLDDATDQTLLQFHDLTKFLDECRLVALHSRTQERVLLASLISLKSVMSESFAHAYVSSIVRAGDALGHETLAEIVADDDLKISTMMPYDILRDDSGGGGWEDPGRPLEGFSPNLTGDVLTKVAHARAIIQKSLRRLQDRHSIKGGTPTFGPYADLASGQSQALSGSSASNSAGKSFNGFVGTPKGFKRRLSSTSEGPAPEGTGSAPATTWALYDPKHYSAPLQWNIGAPENTPYGRHRGGKPSSLGPSPSASGKKQKKSSGPNNGEKPVDLLGRSTFEIDWSEVADSFHDVILPKGASAPAPPPAPEAPIASLKTIISPFCRVIESTPEPSDEESDTEEDLSDEAVLERHQIVLDGMKDKLSAFMEARKKMQERRRKSQKSNS